MTRSSSLPIPSDTSSTTTVVVPGEHVMAALVGPRDQFLRRVEQQFPAVRIRVRGNEVRVAATTPPRSPSVAATVRRAGHADPERTTARRQHPRSGVHDGATPTNVRARSSPTRSCAAPRAARSSRRRPARSATSMRSPTTSSRSVSGRPAPASRGSPWRWRFAALQAKQVERIILTRPAVEAGERLGFLPGDLMAKIDPYLRPLYDALYDMIDVEGVQRLLEKQVVEVAPLAFMRGRTLNNSFIILDEAQNTTPEQMKMFLTRIGFGSRVVVTGDTTQVDVPNGKSGLASPRAHAGGHRQPRVRPARRRRRGASQDRRRHRRRLRATRRRA